MKVCLDIDSRKWISNFLSLIWIENGTICQLGQTLDTYDIDPVLYLHGGFNEKSSKLYVIVIKIVLFFFCYFLLQPCKYLLPAVRHQDMHKKCIVIDLDETLVHSSFKVNIYSIYQAVQGHQQQMKREEKNEKQEGNVIDVLPRNSFWI